MNKSLVGKRYQALEPFTVTKDAALAYARATNSKNPAYLSSSMAPPMYGVAFSFAALGAPLFDPELQVDMMRLVHGEQDMRFLAPVRPGDVITSSSTIDSIVEKATGEVVTVAIECKNQRGEVVLVEKSALFVRFPRSQQPKEAKKDGEPAADPFDAAPLLWTSEEKVAADQSQRYAEASGDHNPIHLDEDAAKMAGLPGIILHGLCSMAFLHNHVVEHSCGGDALRLRRLSVRFARPVLMGDTLTLQARGDAKQPMLRVTNQANIVVLQNAVAEVA